jgi:4-hydroxy-tetrahydrodipicolinate synthase
MFKGSGVAIITPMDGKKNINFDKLKELIEFQIKNHTDAIIVCGTTGESSTLSFAEKKELIKFTVDTVDKRIPVIAGTGCNDTKKSCELSKCAEKLGVDALLVVTPYYNKCSQRGLFMHFKEIANSVTIPIILYNIPGRTNVNIDVPTLIELSSISNICGIKEASTDISRISSIISKLPSDFFIYSGNDDQTFTTLALGGDGVISVAANIIPYQIHDLCEKLLKGDINKAKKIHYKYLSLMTKLFIDVNPIPIKEAMNILGFDVGTTRLPLCTMSNDNIEILEKCIEELDLKI